VSPGRKRLILLAGGLAVGLLLAELILQSYSLLVPARMDLLTRARTPSILRDARLGVRPNPDFWDHDAEGYRNASVPREAFVVAMGDSQTYGTGVTRSENWPHRLQEQTGATVYSISFGGWGPTQSLLLLDRALAFKPRLVVEAFYAGNDLFDCFETVYYDRLLSNLATADPVAAEAIRAAERTEPLRKSYGRLYELVLGPLPRPPAAPAAAPPAARSRGLRSLLREHSKLYQLASLVRQLVSRRVLAGGWDEEKREAQMEPARQYLQVFESGGVRTIFTPVFRSSALDLEDPRLAEGYRIALEALLQMDSRVREARTQFLVLLIPTKELTFRDAAARTLPASPNYWRLIEMEDAVRARTMEFLGRRQIPFVDALPALREAVAAGVQPYQESVDGHPSPEGHRIIARVVAAEMERRGLLPGNPRPLAGEPLSRARTPFASPTSLPRGAARP
jgi:lysophospholipase L1-like esterase